MTERAIVFMCQESGNIFRVASTLDWEYNKTEAVWKANCPYCLGSHAMTWPVSLVRAGTSGTLDVLRAYGWKALQALVLEDRETSAWVDNEGYWYNVPFGSHPMFAKYVLDDVEHSTEKEAHDGDFRLTVDPLIDKYKWMYIH